MTSVFLYKQIKEALVKQRADITASPKLATKLINELGIRDLVIPKSKTAAKVVAKK